MSLYFLFFFYRKSLQIFECLLFETDDLIMRKNEKHVILCLLEVARRGAKFGKFHARTKMGSFFSRENWKFSRFP